MASGRCLIVANETLGGTALDRAIQDSVARGRRSFYIVVPLAPVDDEGWGADEFGSGDPLIPSEKLAETVVDHEHEQEEAVVDARQVAQRRLELVIDKVTALGGEALGEVGTDDPVEATRLALDGRSPYDSEGGSFDEIIVSTLPSGISGWVRMDLPSRIARLADVPVITVEADE